MRNAVKALLILPFAVYGAPRAAPPDEARPADAAGGLRADATFTDVYVNDSFEAADALARARILTRQHRWTEAAEMLQDAADATGDQLVRLGPGSYTGIREHINDIISGWPIEGIEAYRGLYEDKAHHAFIDMRSRRSAHALLPIMHRYFNTAAAAENGHLIGQLALESGDLSLAEFIYRRILERHPDRVMHETRCRNMLAVIAAMLDEHVPAGLEPADDAAIHWMGKDRPLSEVLTEIRGGFAGLREQNGASLWPIFGGRAHRNRRSSAVAEELGLLWRFDGFRNFGERDGDTHPEVHIGGDRDQSRHLSIHPVIADHRIVAQFGREIAALHRTTGALAWRFRADSESGSELTFLEERPPGWDSATIHEGRVFASIPGDTVPYYSYESAHSPPELICLDLSTGAVIWRVEQNAIEEAFAEIVFDSSPIVRHGHMYVVGRRRRSFGFEDCYLFRFHADTGELERRTHLGSASTGSFGPRQSGRAIAAMHGDTVYVCTNLGTVAAVSAHTGATHWLRLYPRDRVDRSQGSVRSNIHAKPWHFNPVIWDRDRIIVYPADSGSIMVLDASDGSPIRIIDAEELGDAEAVLGVQGDRLYVAGRTVTCYDLRASSLRWSTALPEGESIYGRGVLAADRLLVSTRNYFCSFALEDGRRTDSAWGGDLEGGNLLAMPDQLLVSGAGRLSAYVRKSQIWTALRERMAAAPNDPVPALELAEIALSNGDYEEAVTVLGEAVLRAEANRKSVDEGATRRIFDDALTFVDRLSAHDKLATNALDTLFGYAAQFTPDAAAHLRYRFAFAALYEKHGAPKRAVGLYQQILRDRTLRDLAPEPPLGQSGTAGVIAKQRIDELISLHGRDVYARFDMESNNWLTRARQAEDVDLMRRVVATFPNSEAAPRSLLAHGRLLVERGDPLRATSMFARAYHRYPNQIDRPDVLRRIADAYEAGGREDHAYLWLSKAVLEFPKARVEHAGQLISVADYRDRLGHVRSRVAPSRPDISVPLGGRFEHAFKGAVALLRPKIEEVSSADWSRFFVQTPHGVMAHDARNGAELWQEPVSAKMEGLLLIATSKMAVFRTGYEVFALDVRTGKRLWSHGEYPKEVDGAAGDWENGHLLRTQTFHNGRLVVVRDDGEFWSIEVDTGTMQWSQRHRPKPSGRICLADALLAYHIVQDGQTVICLIDAETGDWLDAIHTEQQASVEDLFITLDGQVVLVTSRSISSFDPTAGTLRWRVPTSGHARRTSLLLELDALHFSDDGRSVKKISLEDGRLLWESERLTRRGDDELTVSRLEGGLLVSSVSAVAAVDALSGLTLWQGTPPDRARFVARRLTDAYLIAVHIPGGLMDSEAVAYFYEHQNGSGIIARDGGAARLGVLNDIRTILAVDGSLVIQTGQTIQGWTQD